MITTEKEVVVLGDGFTRGNIPINFDRVACIRKDNDIDPNYACVIPVIVFVFNANFDVYWHYKTAEERDLEFLRLINM